MSGSHLKTVNSQSTPLQSASHETAVTKPSRKIDQLIKYILSLLSLLLSCSVIFLFCIFIKRNTSMCSVDVVATVFHRVKTHRWTLKLQPVSTRLYDHAYVFIIIDNQLILIFLRDFLKIMFKRWGLSLKSQKQSCCCLCMWPAWRKWGGKPGKSAEEEEDKNPQKAQEGNWPSCQSSADMRVN